MIYADIYAGIALSLIGTHVPHAIAHPISTRFPLINHGQSLAYIIIETFKKQIEKGGIELKEKFENLSKILGGDTNFINTINNYIKVLELDKKLQKFDEKDVQSIIDDTLGIGNRVSKGVRQTSLKKI